MISSALKTTPLLVLIFVLAATQGWAAVQKYFQPEISASQEYTDNVFLTDGNEEDEWITTVSPGLTLEAIWQSFETRLSYEAGFSFYEEFDELNSVRHSGSFEAIKTLSRRLTFSLFDTLTRTEEPYDRTELSLQEEDDRPEAPEGIRDLTLDRSREPRLTNLATARLDADFGRRSSAYAEYSYGLVEDDDPAADDSQSHSPAIGGIAWLTDRFAIDFLGEYARGLFEAEAPDREPEDDFHLWDGSIRLIRSFTRSLDGFVGYRHTYIDFDGDEVDYQVYQPSLGVDYRYHEYGTLSLAAAYYDRDFDEDRQAELEEEDDSGFLADGSIDFRWPFRRGVFRILAESGYDTSFFGAEGLGLTIYYGGSAALSYDLTRRLQTNLSAQYRYSEFPDEEPEREDHVATLEGGIRLQLREWLFLDLSDVFRVVDSTEETEEYTENRVILTLTISPEPFRID
jgi:hypothetical protein